MGFTWGCSKATGNNHFKASEYDKNRVVIRNINIDRQEDGNLKAMNIKVIIEPGEDGYFVAHVPSLKSCWSQGKTKEEALQNIREAIKLYLGASGTKCPREYLGCQQ